MDSKEIYGKHDVLLPIRQRSRFLGWGYPDYVIREYTTKGEFFSWMYRFRISGKPPSPQQPH